MGLSFKGIDDQFNDGGKRVVGAQKIRFDERMAGFDSGSCLVSEMCNKFCPHVRVFLSNWEPHRFHVLLKIGTKLRRKF